jgi:hypothetical protein
MTRPLATTSAETSARYFAERGAAASGDVKPRRHGRAPPAYSTDGIEIPRRKRRTLLDLAPISVEILLEVLRDAKVRYLSIERVLVEALEKAR